MSFSFEDAKYMDMLNRQVLHMDQGACYNPEYLATRNMRDYPSRIMQVVRAVYLQELQPSQSGADTVFRSLLTGQGERWQNFGESPYDYLCCQLLGRQLFVENGFAPQLPQPIQTDGDCLNTWAAALPVNPGSDTAILLDQASAAYAVQSAAGLGNLLSAKGIQVVAPVICDTGFTHMAYGQLQQGVTMLRNTIEAFEAQGIKRIITLSGKGLFCLTVLANELGIEHNMQVIDILDIARSMLCNEAFVYGGSFYLRYLGRADRLALLSRNNVERPAANTWEFQPAPMGDRRVNGINIWQSPVCAEYDRGMDDVADSVLNYGIERINAINHKQLVVCDPYAYNVLRDKGVNGLVYFLDALA